MRNRKYLIGAMVGVIGALAFSSVASATPTGQTLQTTLSPKKQSKKTFGGVSLHNIIATTFDNFATSQSPKTTVFTIDPNVKFVNGNIPACPLSSIQGKFTAQAQAACEACYGAGNCLNTLSCGPGAVSAWAGPGGPNSRAFTYLGTQAGEIVGGSGSLEFPTCASTGSRWAP